MITLPVASMCTTYIIQQVPESPVHQRPRSVLWKNQYIGPVMFRIVENQVLKNENGLLNSPDAPLEQAYLHTNLAANTEEGRESTANI